jgi:hypothetical protein
MAKPSLYPFEVDFADEWAQLRKLVSKLKTRPGIPSEAIRRELGPIIYGYRDLVEKLEDKVFRAEIRETADAIRSAAHALDAFERKLSNFPDALKNRFVASLKYLQKSSPGVNLADTYPAAVEYLAVMQAELTFFELALKLSTGVGRRRRKERRPRLPYAYPTMALMGAWTDLTGESIVFPKRERGTVPKESPESTQPPTEFVRLGLKMIDPTSTRSNATTCIRRITDIEKRLAKEGSSITSIRTKCPDIFALAALWRECDLVEKSQRAKRYQGRRITSA